MNEQDGINNSSLTFQIDQHGSHSFHNQEGHDNTAWTCQHTDAHNNTTVLQSGNYGTATVTQVASYDNEAVVP